MTARERSINLGGAGYLTVDRDGCIFVADIERSRIVKLSPRGEVLARWGAIGDEPGAFDGVSGVALDTRGNLYASDELSCRIHKLSPTGEGLAAWGTRGHLPGQLLHPQGLAVDAAGNVVVADTYNSRVQVFSPAGRPLYVWGEGPGRQAGQLDHPTDVAVDYQGNTIVADTRNGRIQKFSPTGQVLAIWHGASDGEDALHCPEGVAVDTENHVYIADNNGTARVIKLSPWGTWLAAWSLPEMDGSRGVLQGIGVDRYGVISLTQHMPDGSPSIMRLSPTGRVTNVWR
jgi:tripartite motif-containing protein 71